MEMIDTHLHAAVSHGSRADIEKWLARGADIRSVNSRGETVLMKSSHPDILRLLIDRGADIHAVNSSGETALMKTFKADILRVLIDHGAVVDARDRWGGRTALFECAVWHKPAALTVLLEAGADCNIRSAGGGTPLMGAAWPFPQDTEAIETIQILLDATADVNAVDDTGKTALIHLVEDTQHDTGHLEIARLLIEGGADVRLRDQEGKSVLDYCILTNREEVAELLRQAGANS
jgi:ankyrin repeat protein